MHKLTASLILTIVLVISIGTLAAAKGTSSIQGVITESKHNQPVLSASVSAYAAHGNGWVASTQTGKDGVFRLKGLSAGEYRLFITKPGYRAVEVAGLTVDTNDHLVVGFPIALEAAPFADADPVQLVARCNSLVNPDEVADLYVVCGGR
jgi:hypothetical protein